MGVYNVPRTKIAEVFRKADIVNFSLGLIRNGVSPSFIKKEKDALPNASFHKTLLRFTAIQLGCNPLIPFPLMRL